MPVRPEPERTFIGSAGSLRFCLRALLALAVLTGCDREPSGIIWGPEGLDSLMSEHERGAVEIGRPQADHLENRVLVRSIPFDRELLIGRIHLDADYRLEYLPAIEAEKSDGWFIELSVLSQSGTEVVNRRQPLPAHAGHLVARARLEATNALARVDLSRWKDQWVSLSWRLVAVSDPGEPPPLAHVARLAMAPAEPAEARPPDILIICSDTHRFDHSARELNGRPLMPFLDSFAAAAVRFDATTAPSSWTLPSVASLLTGLYPQFHRTGTNLESTTAGEESRIPIDQRGQLRVRWADHTHVFRTLPAEIETLAERLSRRGYATFAISANGLLRLSGLGQQGADLFWSLGQARADEIERAIAALAPMMDSDRPLFLYIHLLDVHEYQSVGETELPDRSDAGVPSLQRQRYRHQVEVVDGAIRRLIGWWDRRSDEEESLVVFYSDHGEHLSDPGGPKHGHGITLQEVLLHVPMVVRFPVSTGVTPTVVHSPTSLVDVAATVDDLVFGRRSTGPYRGRSLLEVVDAAAAGNTIERPLFVDYMLMGDERSAVRSGRHKLVVNLTRGREEIFDLSRPFEAGEPSQKVDDPETLAALSMLFGRYAVAAAAATNHFDSAHAADPEDVRRQLEALGYVSP